ncbi:MAG: hypothetical protein KAS07_05545 [Candidatus Pacebacteria bacterium]|nr:hypothetical protein [Candidatus Paceibacterota bacterium]
MKEQSTKILIRRLVQLQKKLFNGFPIMRGSVTELGMGKKQPYFSVSINKKTNLIYLGNNRVRQAKKCVSNYKKMMEIIDEMTLINMELLKRNVDIGKISQENL